MKNVLYGDGVHDDLPAIQEMLDTGISCVYLPPPVNNYLISGTIKVHSDQELRLDRYTHIQLADHANCAMLENADWKNWNRNIKVSGGVWDMNHHNQYSNPGHFSNETMKGAKNLGDWLEMIQFDPEKRTNIPFYMGICFIFTCVKGLIFSDITIVNPVLYGADFAYVENFNIENIEFAFNEGSPKLWNMDGVHIEGFCKNGYIHNLKGACHDNTVALTCDDLIHGPIDNVVVDGIYGENSHSAVRLLSYKNKMRNIHITNIFGTFYRYAVVINKYHASDDKSYFENITIDHVYASECPGTVDVPGDRSPLIDIGGGMEIRSLYISHLFRQETHNTLPTIGIGEGTHIGTLHILCAEQSNLTGKPMTFLNNNGIIDRLIMDTIDIRDGEEIVNNGSIGKKMYGDTFKGGYVCSESEF